MIIANFSKGETCKGIYGGLWQWDYGQVLRIQGLELPTAVEIHFSLREKGGEAVTRVGTTKDGVTDVTIPDSMLENNGSAVDYFIYAFIYLTDATSGQTEYKISMQVKARPKPEAYDTPEDAELFREAIKVVNEAADRAESAEKEAEGWAHGREDMPEKAEDNAKYYADKAAKDAEQTSADRKEVERLVESVSGIDEDVELVRGYKEAAEKAAEGAATSAEKSEESRKASETAKTAAEAAQTKAEEAARKTAEDRTAVEQAKTDVEGMKSQVTKDKTSIEQTVAGFELTAQQAVTNVNNAGQTQTDRVQSSGNTAVQEIQTAKVQTVQSVEDAGAQQIQEIQDEGNTQKQAVQQKGQEVLDSIPEDFTRIQEEVSSLSEDMNKQKVRLESLDGIVFNDINLWEMGAYDSVGGKTESEFAIRSKNQITFERGSVISLKNYSKYRYLFILIENDKTTYSGWRTDDYIFEYKIDALICVATYDGTKIDNINDVLSIIEIKKPNSMALAKQHVIDSYIPIGELQNGSYIHNGKITTDYYSNGYKCTKNIIPVLPNIKITIENFSRISSVTLSYFNDIGEYIGNIETEETGTVLTKSFVLPDDCYGLMITALNNSDLKCYYTDGDVDLIQYLMSNNNYYSKRIEDVKTEIETLNNDINVLKSYSVDSQNIPMRKNYLLSPSVGLVFEYTGYYTSEDIVISNAKQIIFKNCVPSIQKNVGYCFKDYDGLYISGSDYSNPEEEIIEVPVNAKYLVFTVPFANIEKYSFSYIESGRMADMYETYYNNKMFGNIIGSFQSLGVVGDSISSGACSANGGATFVDNYDISWIQFIGKKTGVPCINFSSGGLTTRTWFESPKGYAKLIDENNKCQAYFIALGHNDAFREGDEYIGTKSDIDLTDKDNNADTFYGNYGKIIQTIKELSPKAKIFVINMPYNDDTRKNYNVAIGEMPNIFDNVYLVDQNQDKFYSKDFMKKCHINAHYNALGYNFIAIHIMELVEKIILDNFEDFLEIEFIGTDYSR